MSSDTTEPSGPFAADVAGALTADRPFTSASSGFVGTPSDGLSQLDTYHYLRDQYDSATDGNVVQTAQISDPTRPFTLALGFGPTTDDAVSTAKRSASTPYGTTLSNYVDGWHAYDATLNQPPASEASSYFLSANVIKAAEDKTYPGAFVAAPADPWGQSMLAVTTHAGYTYRSVFARDSYETFTGLIADDDLTSAREMVSFLFDRVQQPDGTFPRDSLVDGEVAPDTYGLYEVDEDAYPLLMAWQAGFGGDQTFYEQHIRPDADFIVNHGPSYGEDRWEEHMGYSPSSIASEIAGLTAAAHLAQAGRRFRRGRACTRPPPTTTSATSSPGRSPTPAPTGIIATSSACRQPGTPTPPRPTTSTTAASITSTSAAWSTPAFSS